MKARRSPRRRPPAPPAHAGRVVAVACIR